VREPTPASTSAFACTPRRPPPPSRAASGLHGTVTAAPPHVLRAAWTSFAPAAPDCIERWDGLLTSSGKSATAVWGFSLLGVSFVGLVLPPIAVSMHGRCSQARHATLTPASAGEVPAPGECSRHVILTGTPFMRSIRRALVSTASGLRGCSTHYCVYGRCSAVADALNHLRQLT